MEPSQKTAMPPIKKPLPALYAAGRVDPAQALQ